MGQPCILLILDIISLRFILNYEYATRKKIQLQWFPSKGRENMWIKYYRSVSGLSSAFISRIYTMKMCQKSTALSLGKHNMLKGKRLGTDD